MKKKTKDADVVVITDCIKRMEKNNVGDIYIYFMDNCVPIVYGRSAIYLNAFFSDLVLAKVLCTDNEKHKVIVDFSLESVIDFFSDSFQQLDDRCFHIILDNVPSVVIG